MDFFDTHCHIHSDDYSLNPDSVIKSAKAAGVSSLICVGTTLDDSRRAVNFVEGRENTWASVGLHPHDSKLYLNSKESAEEFSKLLTKPKVVAIGECGLDYFYNHSKKTDQVSILELQLDLAKKHNLPVIFHVREAFNDFWPIFDNFKGLKGVVHSFTANLDTLNQILSRDLYIGLNGIVTFSKSADQNFASDNVPLNRLVLETDAPYLTPAPFRGLVGEPKYVRTTAEFLSKRRGVSLDELAEATTKNAVELFELKAGKL